MKELINWKEIVKLLPPRDGLGPLVITDIMEMDFKEGYSFTIYRETEGYLENEEQEEYLKGLSNARFCWVVDDYPDSIWGVKRVVGVTA